MVKETDAEDVAPDPHGMLSLHPCWPALEELEQRLETAPLHGIGSEPCGCLGPLCQCDGQHCIAVCESKCLVHYV